MFPSLFTYRGEDLEYCLSQIKRFNPDINAVVAQSQDLVNKTEGPLSGYPVLIKDSMITKGLRTTSGDEEIDYVPNRDAIVVSRIRQAGGIILGKTNVPRLTLDVQTFNDLFGVTNNPWLRNNTAGGSSGGSAAAISMNMASIALGSDLAGSLSIPASFCGVSAFRPTPCRVPLEGHIPMGQYEDESVEFVIGPMAKRVELLDKMMGVIADKWARVEKTEAISVAISSSLDGIITDNRIQSEIINLGNFLNTSGGAFGCHNFTPKLPIKDLIYAHNILASSFLDDDQPQSLLEQAKEIQIYGRTIMEEFFTSFDAWILPVSPTLAFPHNPDHKPIRINKEQISYWKATISYVSWMSLLGNPVLTIPIGIVDGLPLGVQVVGKRGKDEDLIQIGKHLEKKLMIKLV